MDATKLVQQNAAKQVPEITTFTTAADVSGSMNGKKITCTNYLGQAIQYIMQVTGQTAITPPTGIYYIVTIPVNETANNIATAYRTVINANIALTDQIASGTTNSLIVGNRQGGVAGVASTTDTGWTVARTQTGTTTLTEDAGAVASATKYQYFPSATAGAFGVNANTLYLHSIGITLGTLATTTAGKDMTLFGGITALAAGVYINVMNATGTIKKTLMIVKSNYDIANFSTFYVVATGAAQGAIIATVDFKKDYGEEISVEGGKGEYLEFDVQNATTGTGRLNFVVGGRLKP